MVFHQKLSDTKEDQLCLAGIHYLRSHFQEATDIYKKLLLENRDDLALNVYVGGGGGRDEGKVERERERDTEIQRGRRGKEHFVGGFIEE